VVRSLLGLLAVVSVVALASAAGPEASTTGARTGMVDPRMLVLQRSDLPDGFRLDAGHYRSNAWVAGQITDPVFGNRHRTLLKLKRLGRINGYEADYLPPSSTSSSTPSNFNNAAVLAAASIYRTTAGAHDAFGWRIPGAPEVPVDFTIQRGTGSRRRIPLGRPLGDDRLFLRYVYRQQGRPLVDYVLVWREGKALGALSAFGVTPTFPASVFLALVSAQDSRMRKAAQAG